MEVWAQTFQCASYRLEDPSYNDRLLHLPITCHAVKSDVLAVESVDIMVLVKSVVLYVPRIHLQGYIHLDATYIYAINVPRYSACVQIVHIMRDIYVVIISNSLKPRHAKDVLVSVNVTDVNSVLVHLVKENVLV